MNYNKGLEIYDELLSEAGLKRQGKTMPFTSSNGYMFTLYNKAGEIGIRFSKQKQKEYFLKYKTKQYLSYGSKMNGYILVTDDMIKERNNLVQLIKESLSYVNSLDPK